MGLTHVILMEAKNNKIIEETAMIQVKKNWHSLAAVRFLLILDDFFTNSNNYETVTTRRLEKEVMTQQMKGATRYKFDIRIAEMRQNVRETNLIFPTCQRSSISPKSYRQANIHYVNFNDFHTPCVRLYGFLATINDRINQTYHLLPQFIYRRRYFPPASLSCIYSEA